MSKQQIVQERAARNVCIICEDGSGRITRGLCVKHHTRYVTSRKQIPEDRREAYDEYLVANGLLLPSRKGRRVDPDDNEFALAVSDFLAGTVPAAEQLAEKLVEEAAAEPPPEKPAKGRAGAKTKKS